jgi:hypothetical protein
MFLLYLTAGHRTVIQGTSPRRLHSRSRYGAGRQLDRPYVYASPPQVENSLICRDAICRKQWSALFSARRRGDVSAQLGSRTSCIRSWAVDIGQFLALSISEAARHEAGACCCHRGGPAGASQPAPACIRSACRSSVQVGGKDRRDYGIRNKAGKTGEAVAANRFVLEHHQAEVGLPPASDATASATRPAGQA